MPSRTTTFSSAFNSIIEQVDWLYLYLDGHETVPEPARNHPRVTVFFCQDEPGLGCDGKFLGMRCETEACLYAGVDDDILYPSDFVRRLARELSSREGRAVVGVHGVSLHTTLQSYLTDRDVIFFGNSLHRPQTVDALGTGTLMFDTAQLHFDPGAWSIRNKTDLQLAIEAAKRKLPMVCIPRPEGFLTPSQMGQTDSLYVALQKDDSDHTLLARELQAILSSRQNSSFNEARTGIFGTHGIVDGCNTGRFEHRNMLDTEEFRKILTEAPRFVSITDALEGRGWALTIDDATRAAADAARMARELGHEVTLFINPWQIEDGKPSWFSRLDGWLDFVDAENLTWNGNEYDLSNLDGKNRFRTDVKFAMRRHQDQRQSCALIDHLEDLLGILGKSVPEHLTCLTKGDLGELKAMGIDIQNHSWTHSDPLALGPERFETELRKGRAWLHTNLGIDARYLACAYGEYLPHPAMLQENGTVCLLLHNHVAPGHVGDNIFNRLNLTITSAPWMQPAS